MAYKFHYNTAVMSMKEYEELIEQNEKLNNDLNTIKEMATKGLVFIESTYTIENIPQFVQGQHATLQLLLETINKFEED